MLKSMKILQNVSIVGAGMVVRPGIAATMFETIADLGVNIKMISTSEIKISCLVEREEAEIAVKELHKVFELDSDENAEVKVICPTFNFKNKDARSKAPRLFVFK